MGLIDKEPRNRHGNAGVGYKKNYKDADWKLQLKFILQLYMIFLNAFFSFFSMRKFSHWKPAYAARPDSDAPGHAVWRCEYALFGYRPLFLKKKKIYEFGENLR